jgi:hypothetical protein
MQILTNQYTQVTGYKDENGDIRGSVALHHQMRLAKGTYF